MILITWWYQMKFMLSLISLEKPWIETGFPFFSDTHCTCISKFHNFFLSSLFIVNPQRTRSLMAQWPLKSIREFESSENGSFSFRAGRGAPMGAGDYVFATLTNQDGEIYDLLDAYTMEDAGNQVFVFVCNSGKIIWKQNRNTGSKQMLHWAE